MDADQHENLPIARGVLPKVLRAPVDIIYQVVRARGFRCIARACGARPVRLMRGGGAHLSMELSRRVGMAARTIEGNA
ncbi:hypothetical protein OKW42_002102 [Paraburkholderia sp. WC7.3d]